ncbi:MAG: PaaI family thioesterase [Halioglobus sp.]|nr:PaaI family thioesterase [Halioglobus sp.]
MSDNEQPARALERFHKTLRGLMQASIRVDASARQLDELSTTLEQVVATMHRCSRDAIRKFDPDSVPGNMNTAMPYSPVSGHYNPLAADIHYFREGGRLCADARFSELYEGPPGNVHGGIIAGVFDQLLGMTALVHGQPGPTAYLNIQYKKPHPLGTTLRFCGEVERTEQRKVFIVGSCYAGDELLSLADGLFVRMDY